MRYKFRECREQFAVSVIKDGIEVYRNSTYSVSAKWAKDKFGLTDKQLIEMYEDYLEDRDY